jgi:hypothetical protein
MESNRQSTDCEASMVYDRSPLSQLFHQVVVQCYGEIGLHDSSVADYVADMLTEFTSTDSLYRYRDSQGRPLEVSGMILRSDPIYGTARSFDAERETRKHIGDYALFHAGMYPELMTIGREVDGQRYLQMVQVGKDSYHVVSQFNVFEHAAQAPLFSRLAETFELCVFGLTGVRSVLESLCASNPVKAPMLM